MKIQNLKYLLILIFAISCSNNNEADVNASVESLIEKFPLLKNTKKTVGNDYKLVKSVKNGKFDFEIQLLSEPDSIQGKQEIIVFINSKKECYSIPFFSNKYKDYWDFPFEDQIQNVPKVNTTFTKELNIALNKLTEKENSKREYKNEVVNELLFSVLNCRNIVESDSLLVCKTITFNIDIPEESSESAFVRLRKNYELMKMDWHPKEYINNYNCYFDNKKARIYQLKYDINGKQLIIKTYRQDLGWRNAYCY